MIPNLNTTWYQITSSYFCAAISIDDNDIVVDSALILRYMRGWSLQRVSQYCKSKGWKIE